MCSFGSSAGSAPTIQSTTQTTTASPQAQAMYGQAWGSAQKAAGRPFQPYSYDPSAFVAPLNPMQLQAMGNIAGYQGTADPYYQMAGGMAGMSGMTMTPELVGQYMSPYMSQVVDPVRRAIEQQQGMQRSQQQADQIQAGAFGQERGQLMRAVLEGQQNLGLGQALSPLYQTGYGQALGAAQTDLARQLQAAQVMGGLGTGAQAAGLSGAQAMLGAGTLGQQTQQAGLQALYNQYLQQQQYPFMTAQMLSQTAGGLGPGYGSTTSGTQISQQPLSYWGNTLSDPKLKTGAGSEDEPEVIGETKDGQKIYRYRLINPETGELGPAQIGLMADEVEERTPEAVGNYKGFKTVDYAKATDDAARMGGGVMGRGDYADGGGIDDISGILKAQEEAFKGITTPPSGLFQPGTIPSAKLESPALSYASPKQQEQGSMAKTLMDSLGLYKGGKEALGLGKEAASALGLSSLLGGSGGTVGALGGAPVAVMGGLGSTAVPTFGAAAPVAEAAGLGSLFSGAGAGLSGLGSAAASGLAGLGETLMAALPAALAFLSDPKLKTGVRPRFADGGAEDSDLESYLSSLAKIETGGRKDPYSVVGPHTKYGDPIGKYQILEKNIPQWSREAGLEPMTREQFLGNKEAQETVARNKFKEYLSKSGDPEEAAAMWFGGPGYKKHLGARDVLGTSIPEYQARFRRGLGAGAGETVDLKNLPENARSFMASAAPEKSLDAAGEAPTAGVKPSPEGLTGFLRGTAPEGAAEKAGDFLTSERFLVPLLTGLGTMASSGSRYLAPSILQGLGAGAKAYMEVPKQQADIELTRQEALNKAALTPKFAAEVGEVLAKTAEAKARTAREQADTINSAIVERGGRLFVRIVKPNGLYDLMPFGEWNGMDPNSRPPLVPGGGSSGQPGSPTVPTSGAVKPPAAGAAPAPEATPGSFDLSPDQATEAQKAAAAKAGWSTTNQASVPDFFAPQAEIAKSAQDQKQIIIPLASSLAQLPKGNSLLASGKAQEFLSPLAATLNNLASVAGFKGLLVADPKALANQEEVKKLVTQLQREATTSSQMHAYHAFKDMAEGIPGIFTSPEGQGKLIAQILTNTQRQIDKNEFFSKWAKAAGGKNGSYGEWARLTSPEANLAFDSNKGTNARYATDRELLEKMFNDRVMLTDDNGEPVLGSDGLPQKMSLLAAVATHPDILKSPAYRKAFEEKYPPSILRYFGIQ